MKESIKIGTRASKLALWQAEWVKSALTEAYPNQPIELVPSKPKVIKSLMYRLQRLAARGFLLKKLSRPFWMAGLILPCTV